MGREYRHFPQVFRIIFRRTRKRYWPEISEISEQIPGRLRLLEYENNTSLTHDNWNERETG